MASAARAVLIPYLPAAVRICRISPSLIPQRGTTFFASGRSVRPQVLDTVARDQLDADAYFYTGMIDNKEQDADALPGDHDGTASAARSGSTFIARPATLASAMVEA